MADETEKVEKIARKVAEEMVPEKHLPEPSPVQKWVMGVAITVTSAAVIGGFVLYGTVQSLKSDIETLKDNKAEAEKYLTHSEFELFREGNQRQIDDLKSDIERLHDAP